MGTGAAIQSVHGVDVSLGDRNDADVDTDMRFSVEAVKPEGLPSSGQPDSDGSPSVTKELLPFVPAPVGTSGNVRDGIGILGGVDDTYHRQHAPAIVLANGTAG